MIGSLRGMVASVDAGSVLIDVHGVGFEVHMPGSELSALRPHHEVTLYTYLAVSQDAISLYGFTSKSAKALFLQLQKVSGVGPKAALSLLSTLPAEPLLKAISQQDVAALTKAPGIGKKGAQKIILELSGKMASMDLQGNTASPRQAKPRVSEITQGLVSLGWQQRDAEEAVAFICSQQGYEEDVPREDVSKVLRQALAYLGKGN